MPPREYGEIQLRILYEMECGYSEKVYEVPSPVYCQALLLEIAHPAPRGCFFVLPSGLEDVPENYLRARQFRVTTREFVMDWIHWGYKRLGFTKRLLFEDETQARVPFLRGRLHEKTLHRISQRERQDYDRAAEYERDRLRLGFGQYLSWVMEQVKLCGRWDQTFPYWVTNMASEDVKSFCARAIEEGMFDLLDQRMKTLVIPQDR